MCCKQKCKRQRFNRKHSIGVVSFDFSNLQFAFSSHQFLKIFLFGDSHCNLQSTRAIDYRKIVAIFCRPSKLLFVLTALTVDVICICSEIICNNLFDFELVIMELNNLDRQQWNGMSWYGNCGTRSKCDWSQFEIRWWWCISNGQQLRTSYRTQIATVLNQLCSPWIRFSVST